MNNFDPEQQAFFDAIANQRNYFCNESARVQAQLIVLSKKCDDLVAELKVAQDKLAVPKKTAK